MGSLEAEHDGSLARVVSHWISRTDHTRNEAPRKICDRAFNTSEPEHRFYDLKEVLRSGENWAQRAQQYDEELRRYITQNLLSSEAYVLLVTGRSLTANSSWVKLEIETARSEALNHLQFFFFPCVADGASLGDLPEGAFEFQGIELEQTEGVAKLARTIVDGFSQRGSQKSRQLCRLTPRAGDGALLRCAPRLTPPLGTSDAKWYTLGGSLLYSMRWNNNRDPQSSSSQYVQNRDRCTLLHGSRKVYRILT
jgi:hypothetical protein